MKKIIILLCVVVILIVCDIDRFFYGLMLVE